MSTPTYPVRDSVTMLRRNLRHMRHYPSLTVQLVLYPIVFLLLFVYVFGATLGAGLEGASGSALGGREQYLAYITPGILIITVASVALSTAISVATDTTQGIIARFRTMHIARVSVLTGHVLGAMIQTTLALVVVLGVAVLLGFRATTGPADWLAAAGLLALLAFALTWLTVALGLVSGSVETASNLPTVLVLLPFLGSGFVPTGSMPSWLRWFAEHQPFTPVIETLRGLLLGTPIGGDAVVAVLWCAAIAAGGYLWAARLFTRVPAR